MKNAKERNTLIIYNCKTKQFTYTSGVEDHFSANFDARPLWQIWLEDGLTSATTAEQFRFTLEKIAAADTPQVYFTKWSIKDTNQINKKYRVGFVCPVPGEVISITFTDIGAGAKSDKVQETDFDELTGLLKREAFSEAVVEKMLDERGAIIAGEYSLVYFDVIRFKAINDMFGMAVGDELLKYIADTITQYAKAGTIVSRLDADRFVIFTRSVGDELEELIENILGAIQQYDLPFKITCNVGIYVTNEEILSVDSMLDRAVLAQSFIKGSYTSVYNYFTESLRKDMLSEQEISGIIGTALEEKQLILYYQPQFNHATGKIVGAEALVRWIHPERGMISPGVFIPICEKNGFITEIDLYVFERVCEFIRRCIDNGLPIVPISSNFSQHDIFQHNFVEKLEELRKKYNVPTEYLRVEITESVVAGGSQRANEVVKHLQECGYIVEMDDFGSGYSSLNVLKDIEMDIIKLDMMFLSGESAGKRGGTILSSMVRMAKWLGMPVIAEGVETPEQADFLQSIGCDYIQGYLYSRPLPEKEYVELLRTSKIGFTVPKMNLIDTLDAYAFWDPKSQETLIFSNYVGGAAIFEYHDGQVEVLRVNKKYLQEFGIDISERELIDDNPMRFFDEENSKVYIDMLERAIQSCEEEECETWRGGYSRCCKEDKVCIRTNARLIGKSDESFLFYAMIRNITVERQYYDDILARERRFKMASEQANIYYWEYDVATKEMRPCFRCIRDLGLPPLVTNYPEPAFEMGIFPPEVADMYRDWHRQIEEGAKELDAIIPLTEARVPFRVKYTTEFDEKGKAIRAYGSAALVE